MIRGALDWLAHKRDRWLSSPEFQRRATAFPLTRLVARHRARTLFDLAAGFVYSQILFACVQLGLFAVLAEGPATAAAIADRIGLGAESADRLLAAGCALGLVERRGGGRFGLGGLGAALAGNPGLAALIDHHSRLYADLADPVGLLRRDGPAGALAAYWPYAGAAIPASASAENVAAYSSLMAASNAMIAPLVLDAYPVGRHRLLLDVGGGEGAFAAAAAARAPALEVAVFDLPAVAIRAREHFARLGLGHRAVAYGGDFFRDAWPEGADLISLVRVVHDHDDGPVRALLQAARAALAPGGTLLLAEPMARSTGAERMGDAYFGFYLLAMGSGRPRSAETLRDLLLDCGFSRVSQRRTHAPMLTGLLVAQA